MNQTKRNTMKKLIALIAAGLLLTACTDKNNYEQAVLEEVKKEKDLQDYKITPEHMTSCVVDLSSKNMPGIIPVDPSRMQAYRSYTKMLKLSESSDPQKYLAELRTEFGSPKALADAHSNYTQSYMDCIAAIIAESDDSAKTEKPAAPAAPPPQP